MGNGGTARERAPVCDVFAIDEKLIRNVARRALESDTAAGLAATFKVLGSPTRVRILDALAQDELCVCDLAVLLDMRISAVSHQLALLREHDLVRSRRAGKMVYYTLDDDHVRSLFAQGLAHLKHGRRAKGGRR
jgi:ArsR family transcriptional regulator